MFSRLKCVNKLFVAAFIPGFTVVEKENVAPVSKTAQLLAEQKKTETGMDRLYMMFSTDEWGEPSAEIINVTQVMIMSMFVGAAIGGFVRSRVAFLDFVERNDATSFGSHLEAKQKLQDKVTIGFGKGAMQWGWRLSAFTGIYTLSSTAIAVYRGENGIIEHVIGGMLTGAAYKINLGLKGVVVGSCVGAVLGTFSGVSIWGILKLTGLTMDEVRQPGYKWKKERESSFQAVVDDHLRAKEPAIINKYEDKIGHNSPSLDNIKTEAKSK